MPPKSPGSLAAGAGPRYDPRHGPARTFSGGLSIRARAVRPTSRRAHGAPSRTGGSKTMTTHTRWTAALAAATLLAASPVRAAAGPSLDRLKALAGEWVAAEDNEMVKKGELVSRYVVSAGGTAVVETVFP